MSFLLKREDIKYIAITFFVISLCYLSLLRIDDYFYLDDHGRKAYGAANFLDLSRYLSEYLAHSFTIPYKNFFTIAPLSQVLSLFFLSLAGVILVKVYSGTLSIFNSIVAAIIGIYPFFYQNIVYTFDAAFMGLSVALAVLPLVFYKNLKVYATISTICTVAVLTSYQSSSGIYPALVSILLLKLYFLDGKSLSKLKMILLTSLFSYGLGCVIFILFFYNSYSGHISTDVMSISNLWMGITQNSILYVKKAIKSIGKNYILYFSAFIFLYIYFLMVYKSKNKYISCLVVALSLIIVIILSAGLPLFLSDFTVQTRYMLGLNSITTAVVLLVSKYGNKIIKFLIILFIVNLLALGNIMGNIVNDQWQYDKFRITLAIGSLMPILTDEYKLSFSGNPINRATFNQKSWQYPIVHTIIYHKSNFSLYGNKQLFSRYLPLSKGNVVCNAEKGKLISSDIYQNIYKNGKCYHLQFL